MASVVDSVFVVAGINDGGTLSSVEEHDTNSDSWEKVGDLQVAVSSSGVVAIGDVIIVVGDFEKPDVIQTFNVRTRVAVLLDTLLPCPMKTVSAAGLTHRAVFAEENGGPTQLSLSKNEVTVISHVRLSGFGRRQCFGLAVADDHLLCFGGGPNGRASKTVERYSWQGEREPRDHLPKLPVALRVHGAFYA